MDGDWEALNLMACESISRRVSLLLSQENLVCQFEEAFPSP